MEKKLFLFKVGRFPREKQFFDMPVDRFAVGQRVQGRIARLRNMNGTITDVIGTGRQVRYRVCFEDGRIFDCSTRGISPNQAPLRPAVVRPEVAQHLEEGGSGDEESLGSSSSDGSDSTSSASSDLLPDGGELDVERYIHHHIDLIYQFIN